MTIPTEPKPTSPAMTEGGLAEIERRWESLGPLEYGQYQSMANYADEVIPYLIKAVRSLASARAAAGGDADALTRYRAVTHWIGADAWDGCPDCMERLRWAAEQDQGREMTAAEAALITSQFAPTIPDAGSAGEGTPGYGVQSSSLPPHLATHAEAEACLACDAEASPPLPAHSREDQ